jgi:hypothetical protein
MKKSTQAIHGFGILEVIIVVGILALIVAGGFYGNYFLRTRSYLEDRNLVNPEIGDQIKQKGGETQQQITVERESSAIDASTLLSTSTSTWKIYRNERYGFEFKYPDYWETTDNIDYIQTDDIALYGISSEETNSTLIDYATSIKNNSYPCQPGKISSVKVAALIAIRCSSSFDTEGPNMRVEEVFIQKSKKIINVVMIIYTEKLDLVDNYTKLFDQILSTFKFTK